MREYLDGVSVFVEAVEAGGFARAGEKLALSRSAVGKTIARMEARLGVILFHRSTRNLTLTDDGQIYFEHCLKALEALRTGASLIESGRRDIAGKLKVSVPVLFGRRCVAPILLELARSHPNLELEINYSDYKVDVIEQGYDLAVRNGTTSQGAGLLTRRLASQRKVMCAAPSYLSVRGTPKDIDSLEGHELLVYRRGDHLHTWNIQNGAGDAAEIGQRARLRFDDLEAIVDAAVQGMGLAWLPTWLVRDHFRRGTLVPVLDHLPTTDMGTYAVWPEASRTPMRLRAAIDALAKELPNMVDFLEHDRTMQDRSNQVSAGVAAE